MTLRPSRFSVLITLAAATLLAAEYRIVREWDFNDGSAQGWTPGRHLAKLAIANGAIGGTAEGHDPHLVSPLFGLPATPFHELWARVRCSRDGTGELFYTNTTEGKFSGFTAKKIISYKIKKADVWQVVKLKPYWHTEGKIIRLRFDPPGNATTEVDWIRIVEPSNAGPTVETAEWLDETDGTPNGWHRANTNTWRAPAIATPLAGKRWLTIDLTVPTEGLLRVRWATDSANGQQDLWKFLGPDGRRHRVDLEMSQRKSWSGRLLMLEISVTTQNGVPAALHGVAISSEQSLEPDVHVLTFAQENAINRVGRPATFLLRLLNDGGTNAKVSSISFRGAAQLGVIAARSEATAGFELLPHIPKDILLTVQPIKAGAFPIQAEINLGNGEALIVTSRPMKALPAYKGISDGTTPPPKPAKTKYMIGSYYYPGFGSARQWRQLERTAPFAKPVLGYYDEGNPECIDWQIKWSVEHGVNFFLVDWYWAAGRRHNLHWLNAFSKSRFRNQFKWAVMWANHNRPNTHSEEDWRAVTRYWIDNYFKTPEYLRIDGKPLVVIWSPGNIRRDMGGSDGAARLLRISDEMAEAAGLPGVRFYSMNQAPSQKLADEGYTGATRYHWWSDCRNVAEDSRYFPFSLVVDRAPRAWDAVGASARDAGLRFWPVADTGWDARPRHGDKTLVIHNRTPERFRQHLQDAKKWMDRNDENVLVLGPWNEWTEGSYIEPCAEWGFGMLQAVHNVFCEGDAPLPVGPRDAGLGPYDFDLESIDVQRTEWDFAKEGKPCGWYPMMGLENLACTADGMTAESTTHDPAFMSHELELPAKRFRAVEVTLSLDPPRPLDSVLLFWATGTAPCNGRAFVRAELTDAPEQTHVLVVGDHPGWRGIIRGLRLDPCTVAGVKVTIKRMRLMVK